MKIIKKIIRTLLGFIFIFFSLPLLLYIPQIYDSNFYKNQITSAVETYTEYKLKLDSLDLSVYPDLKLNLKNIELKTKNKDIEILKLEEINLAVFFLPALAGGKLQVDDLSLRNGFVDIPNLLSSIPEQKEESPKEEVNVKQITDIIHTKLRIKQIQIENTTVYIKKLNPYIYHDPFIKKITFSFESFWRANLDLLADYGKTNLNLSISSGISPEDFSLSSLVVDSNIKIANFNFLEYNQFLKDIPLQFQSSFLNLEIRTKKEKDSIVLKNEVDLFLNRIGYKNDKKEDKSINGIQIKGNIYYPLLSKKIETEDLKIFVPRLLDVKVDSSLQFFKKPILQLNLFSNHVYINEILDFAGAFAQTDTNKQSNEKKQTSKSEILLKLKYFAQHIKYDTFDIHNFFSHIDLNNSALNYNLGLKKIADGNIQIQGEAELADYISTNADIQIENINLEKFTKQFLNKKYAEGNFVTSIKLQTNNQFGEKDFLKNLYLTGFTRIEKGILLERADLLYPIRFLTKIIPDSDKWNGNISRFDFMDIDYSIKNNRFKVKNLDMKGLIFNTNGSADIGLNDPSNDIAVNLIVSTRIASTGLKIPLVYSKSSYVPLTVDKVWLASTYTGMVVGGPVGAVVGSLLSEKAGLAFQTIHNKTKDKTEILFNNPPYTR